MPIHCAADLIRSRSDSACACPTMRNVSPLGHLHRALRGVELFKEFEALHRFRQYERVQFRGPGLEQRTRLDELVHGPAFSREVSVRLDGLASSSPEHHRAADPGREVDAGVRNGLDNHGDRQAGLRGFEPHPGARVRVRLLRRRRAADRALHADDLGQR